MYKNCLDAQFFSPPRRVYVTAQTNDGRQRYLQHTLSTHTHTYKWQVGYRIHDYWAPNWTHANKTPETTTARKEDGGGGHTLTTQECIAWETRIGFHTRQDTTKWRQTKQWPERAQHPGTHDNYHQVTKQRRNKRGTQPRQTKKQRAEKDYHRLSVTSFFFLDYEFCSFTSREKLLFFFRTLFSLQLVINQAANVTISQRTNRTPEIRLEHIPSWSQAKKKYVYTEREGTKNQLHARRQ